MQMDTSTGDDSLSRKLAKLVYEIQGKQVLCQGYYLSDNDAFDSFMMKDVAARLNDEKGSIEFESHLRSLSLTGFGVSNLEALLSACEPQLLVTCSHYICLVR